ncbi:MAG: UDP-2,3-diacylglucosamine diphosphatase [Flavobacteriales bacterium]|nr:UDP-2,3-diacylglucosamine diphosphatase [Flavobacteriales bacterium]
MSNLPKGKIYFASDFHLGAPNEATSLVREKLIVKWLDEISSDASEIFLVGDVFDFWFEYKRAVPRGYTRLLGKISELTDRGIAIHWFLGNHDMWIFDYIPSECGVQMHGANVEREWNGKRFLIGHGDGLGPDDHGYKIVKKIFRSKVCQWLFARLHPNFGIWLAHSLSGYSRSNTGDSDRKFLGDDKEWLMVYCKDVLKKQHYDYFIFGHRHLPLDKMVGPNSRYVNLGEWLHYNSYASWDGSNLELKYFEN